MRFKEGDIIFINDGVGSPDQGIYIIDDAEEGSYWMRALFMINTERERTGTDYVDRQSEKLTLEEIDFARMLFR